MIFSSLSRVDALDTDPDGCRLMKLLVVLNLEKFTVKR